MNTQLQLTDPALPEAQALLRNLNEYLSDRYAKEHCHVASLEQLKQPGVDFVLARQDEQALGCGALFVCHDQKKSYGEIKRIFVSAEARGKGIAKAVMGFLERRAREKGLSLLRLETGIHQSEAVCLYQKLGFRLRPAYGDYVENGVSLFMEKSLG
ncbi:MAG: GNAT family N-acetyltransferase [Spirochaetales bacterium]|nr:GNAT family N-acetyltransferase [Spirochaetales bacterium]